MATTIHVGNLSFGLDEKDLNQFFSKYGKVTDTYVVRRYGRPRGYGFVEFDSSAGADNALSANGESLDGRNINIEKAKGNIQKSNFTDDSRPSFNPGRRYNNNYGDRNNNYGDRNNNDGGYRPQRRYNNYRDNDNDGDNDSGYRPQRRYNNNRDNDGDRDNDSGYRPFRRYNNNRDNDGDNDSGYRSPRRYNNRDDDGGSWRGNNRTRGTRGRVFYSLRSGNQGSRRPNNRNFVPRRQVEKEESATTVYVSNLPFSVDDAQLAKIFNKYKVKTTHIVQTGNGRSRGYGFVEFETEEDQKSAVTDMDGSVVKGSDDRERNIMVKVALVEKPGQNTEDNEDRDTKTDDN